MTKPTSKTEKLQTRIAAAMAAAKPAVLATYTTSDTSTQAELRLAAGWKISLAVDQIAAPRDMAGLDLDNLWSAEWRLRLQIANAAQLASDSRSLTQAINNRSKTDAARRNELQTEFLIAAGRDFLAALKTATGKRTLAATRKKIEALQAEQQALIARMRKANGEYMAERRSAKAAQREADAAALASGEFWHASREALKDHFRPPFSRNHLADVSERWRAVLYTEMDSTAWKAGRGDWRHKNIGTGWAYLCGIDDNGDEWGHRINLAEYMDRDQHGDLGYEATVEEAMAELFDISPSKLETCTRQGDLLFRPCSILKKEKNVCANCGADWDGRQKCCSWAWGHGPIATRTVKPPHLEPETEWEVRESHRITSPSLRHNGRYFAADDTITVEHTSHQPVTLPPGEYCLHTLKIANAD